MLDVVIDIKSCLISIFKGSSLFNFLTHRILFLMFRLCLLSTYECH